MPQMGDNLITYLDKREHPLVSLCRAYKPVALLYFLPDLISSFSGLCSGPNLGVWLADDVPCSEYFVHSLWIGSIIDNAFGPDKYRLVVLNTASRETRQLFVQYGCMVFARSEPDRVGFIVSANADGNQQAARGVDKRRELLRLGSKIVEFGGRSLLRRYTDRKGMLIDFRPPTVQV